MAALIVIERLGRHGELLERLRQRLAAGEALRIGRGWDCQVHLDDPYVALHHASLRLDASGSLELLDEGGLNGIVEAGSRRRVACVRLDRPVEVRLGQTRLRLIDGRAAQVAERPLPSLSAEVSWQQAFAWLLGALGLSLLLDWAAQVGEIRSSALLIGALAGAIMMLAWSFGWALLTRLFVGEMRFLRHLRVVAVGGLLASLLMLVVQYLSYALAFEPLMRFDYVGYWLLFAAVCWRHLAVMGAGDPRAKALTMLGAALLAIGLHSLSLWQPRGGQPREARYVRNVVLPGFRLSPLQDVDAFLTRAAGLESELVDARHQDAAEAAAAAVDAP